MQTVVMPQKSVHIIPAQVNIQDEIKSAYRQLRVAAYCRVSTKEEEQLNSYEVQTKYYTEKINSEPKWSLVGIFADKGISGAENAELHTVDALGRTTVKGKSYGDALTALITAKNTATIHRVLKKAYCKMRL